MALLLAVEANEKRVGLEAITGGQESFLTEVLLCFIY